MLGLYGVAIQAAAGAGDISARTPQATDLWSLQRIGERVPGGIGEYTYALAFSPDHRRIVSISQDAKMRIWDAATGEAIGEPRHFTGYSVAWSPDGDTIAIGTVNGQVALSDAGTGQTLRQAPVGQKAVTALAFSPDSRHFAASTEGDKAIRILDGATGKELCHPLSGHRESVTGLAFVESGKTLVSAGRDGTIRQWSVASCKEGRPAIESKNGFFRHLAVHPAGRVVAVAAREGPAVNDRHGGVEFWDLGTGQSVASALKGYGGTYGISGLAFSADGERLMVADGSGGVALLEWKTGRLVARGSAEHEDVIVWRTAFSPRGDLVATAGKDNVLGIWSARVVPAHATPLALAAVGSYTVDGALPALSDDGRLVAFGKEKSVLVRETATGKVVLEAVLSGRAHQIVISPDGKWLAVRDDRVRVWHVPTKRASGEWNYYWTEALTFSPDNTRLAIGAFSSAILVDCLSGREIGRYQIGNNPHHPRIAQLVFDPTGKLLLAATQEGDVHRLDASTLRPVGEPWVGMSRYGALAFSPDGRRLVAARRLSHSEAAQLVVLDAASGAQLAGPMEESMGWVHALAFTPDGRYLLAAGGNGTLSLWDSGGGERIARVPSWGQGHMRGVRFSRDLRRLYACNVGTYTRTDCRSWTVSLNAPEHAAVAGQRPVARAMQATVVEVAEVTVGSLSNAIDFSSNRLNMRHGIRPLIVLNNGVSRFVPDSGGTSAAAAIYEDSAVSADGNHVTVALYNNQLAIFDFRSGEFLNVVDLAADYHEVHAFLSDGSLALDDGRGSLRIVNPKTGDSLRTLRYPHPVHGNVTVLAAGNGVPLIVIGTSEGALLFERTDIPTVSFRIVERAHRGAVATVALSPDERWMATGGVDGQIRLFDTKTGTPVAGPWSAHARAVTAIGFNADASLLVSGSADGTVRVWNVQSGKPVTDALVGHTEPVLAITFDPSTGQVLSFGRDNKRRNWNISLPPGTSRTFQRNH